MLNLVCAERDSSSGELLLLGPPGRTTRVAYEERAAAVPLISFLLHEYYVLGGFIDTGERLGTQVEASLSYLLYGEKRTLRGAAVSIGGGALLVVPFGFFARMRN